MLKGHLAAYLNDHLAGSVVALELLGHLQQEATDLKPQLAQLKTDIEADRDQLKSLMDRLGILESRIRKLTGWIAEQLTEAKLEVDDESLGSLRRLERLEAVAIGIHGKLALWSALHEAAKSVPQLRGPDYPRLVQRAEDQRLRVEVLRLQAAAAAFN